MGDLGCKPGSCRRKGERGRRLPRSRAQRMGLGEEMEGLGEDELRVFENISPVVEREV